MSPAADRRYSSLVPAAAAFFFAIGAAGYALPALGTLVEPTAPFVLLAFGLLVAAPRVLERDVGFGAWFLLAYAATFALEALGVATGLVFGPYEYGEGLGFEILRVPPLIGFNWILVVLGARGAAAGLLRSAAGRILATGALAAAFDWILEPAAVLLGYWRWLVDPIPFRNYAAWFAIAALCAAGLELLPSERRRSAAEPLRDPLKELLPARYLLVQLLFFAAIRLLLGGGA